MFGYNGHPAITSGFLCDKSSHSNVKNFNNFGLKNFVTCEHSFIICVYLYHVIIIIDKFLEIQIHSADFVRDLSRLEDRAQPEKSQHRILCDKYLFFILLLQRKHYKSKGFKGLRDDYSVISSTIAIFNDRLFFNKRLNNYLCVNHIFDCIDFYRDVNCLY